MVHIPFDPKQSSILNPQSSLLILILICIPTKKKLKTIFLASKSQKVKNRQKRQERGKTGKTCKHEGKKAKRQNRLCHQWNCRQVDKTQNALVECIGVLKNTQPTSYRQHTNTSRHAILALASAVLALPPPPGGLCVPQLLAGPRTHRTDKILQEARLKLAALGMRAVRRTVQLRSRWQRAGTLDARLLHRAPAAFDFGSHQY